MYCIENKFLKVRIKEQGAELSSIILKETGEEYLYQADPKYWNKQSPVLFPCIGMMHDEEFEYNGNTYPMTKHGFSRDYPFTVSEHAGDMIDLFQSNKTLMKKDYPFLFEFHVRYELVKDRLKVTYRIFSHATEIYFTVGGHPAFKVPMAEGLVFDDYKVEIHNANPLTKYALVGPFVDEENRQFDAPKGFQLNHQLFAEDALVYETPGDTVVRIVTDKDHRGVEVSYQNIPYVGLWTKTNNAPYLCIEPWDGLPDRVVESKKIEEKPTLMYLEPYSEYEISYDIHCF
ncbi:Galactose mutarotase [Granulicatella balaenopterae]|uniref:Galactose mutarotase n=1 Tax=Granulicatella balaenopterae TaxID=137733 RepID=A0A1H9JY88_9LACT|nr:aldose 1-epimerase family protein [Granulicatella balaenopterae]SEQ91819.1 Galactose mutarotase [Granulicatella balaenopterae]